MNVGRFAQISRRSFLHAGGGTLGAALLNLNWREVAAAVHEAQEAAKSSEAKSPACLTPLEFGIVEAVAAQIVPTDATPGAREAGVVYFIDQAFATFFARMGPRFRAELTGFHDACRERHPDAESFVNLTHDQQLDWLRSVEDTPFFHDMLQLTMLGMFTSPTYGGNRDGLGWQLIAFQDQHIFEPPFGHYDRDYPGFEIQSKQGR